MNLPNLSQLYDILHWHKERNEKEKFKKAGVFIPIPSDLSQYFPKDGTKEKDDSPKHLTLVYIGDIDPNLEDNLVNIISSVCSRFRPFKVKMLKKPRKFFNDENQTVLHMPISSRKLSGLHEALKQELLKNMIQVSNKYPEYKPHVTLEYVNENEKPKYKNFRFSENKEFMIESVWVWGTNQPYLIPLGKK